MNDIAIVTLGLAAATLLIRLSGVWIGHRLPQTGPVARGLNALPGCLIIALVATLLMSGGPAEWIAGAIAAVTALATRSLPLTMATGIATVALLRFQGMG